MLFGKHVFISYSHGDNLEVAGPGWVSRFHDLLDVFLTSNLKRTRAAIWRDKRLAGNDVFDPVIMQHVSDSAVLVAIVSDNYVESEWCRREAEAFCEAAQRTIGLAPQNKSRVFKIIRLPPEREDGLPVALREIIGSKFFVRIDRDERESKDENDKPVPLDPCYGEEYGKRLNLRVCLLAQDIASTLKVIEGAAPAPSQATPAAAVARPTVYLAQCGSDRVEDREALRSELTMAGYPVLPDRELPSEFSACRAEVARMLERSGIAVHLLGASRGVVPDGSEDPVTVIQNTLAIERARVKPLARVVSLADDASSTIPAYQQFLDAMRRDADVQFGAEVITAGLEGVKTAVYAALARLEAPLPADPRPDSAVAVFVVFDERDRKATVPLRKALAARGLTVWGPVFEGTAQEVREANEQRLAECDAVVVFYGSGTEAWKASVESEIRKARALRQARPAPVVFTYVAAPATSAKADAIDVDEPNLINGLEGFSDDLVEPIATSLLRTRS